MPFENLLLPSGRQESAELILAECCGSIELPLSRDQNLSKRVCRPCSPKFRNTEELYNFIEKAVSAKAEDLNRGEDWRFLDCHAGTKQRKKLLNDSEKITVGKASSRKVLIFAEVFQA